MQMEKGQIVEHFLRRGDIERAEQADETLPDVVDTAEHAEELSALGLDVGLLATQVDNLEA